MSSDLRKLFCLLARARIEASRRKKSLAQAAPSRGQPWALFPLCSRGTQHQPQPCLSRGLIYPRDHCPKDSLETLNTSAGTMPSLLFLPGNMAGADQTAVKFQVEVRNGAINIGKKDVPPRKSFKTLFSSSSSEHSTNLFRKS